MVFSGPSEVALWLMVWNKRYLIKNKIKNFPTDIKELCEKMYPKKFPGFFSSTICFHSFTHSFFHLLVHSVHQYWEPKVLKATGALSHLLALQVPVMFSTVLECLEMLNYTVSCLSQYYCWCIVKITVCSLFPLPVLIFFLPADGELKQMQRDEGRMATLAITARAQGSGGSDNTGTYLGYFLPCILHPWHFRKGEKQNKRAHAGHGLEVSLICVVIWEPGKARGRSLTC